jgi:hypothetical protein
MDGAELKSLENGDGTVFFVPTGFICGAGPLAARFPSAPLVNSLQ